MAQVTEPKSFGWYSERLTPLGTWSPQITPDKPRQILMEGARLTLRRVRELRPSETHLSLGAIKAGEDAREAAEFERARQDIEDDGFVTIFPDIRTPSNRDAGGAQ